MWALVLVFLPLLLWLGFWQLDRAEQKNAQQDRWDTLSSEEWPLTGQANEGQPVIISGRYVPDRQWLLDNRTRDGRVGYEVLSLLQPTEGPPVVVNRGWVAGMRNRADLPAVSTGSAMQRLEARVADWPAPPVIGAVEQQTGWPKRVQSLTHEAAARTSGEPVSETFLRLADEQQPGALRADWPPSHTGASTHYGYAVQWFGLAIALVVLSIIASLRKPRSTDSTHD